jgi:hypothetical protein
LGLEPTTMFTPVLRTNNFSHTCRFLSLLTK